MKQRQGLSVSKEAMGAFIDAVYAIAVTILALEIPTEIEQTTALTKVGEMIINYAISFCILFALWVQHRRINLHIEAYHPVGLWLNALILMLVCLVPRATTFVFEYGGQVDLDELEKAAMHGNWALPEIIDAGFVGIVLACDIALVALLHLTPVKARREDAADIYQSKVTISILLILVMASSLIFPFRNRFFLVLLPVFLMFEHLIAAVVARSRERKSKPAS